NLRIATNERRPDGSGGWQDATEWHTVVLFGKQADLAKQYLAKGRTVLIEGSLRTRQWQDKDRQKRRAPGNGAPNMRIMGGRGTAGGGMERASEEQGAPVGADDLGDFGGGGDDSDIPF